MKRIRAICVATLADGTVIEGREAQELLTDIMDFGWPGPIGTAPQLTYRLAEESDPPDAIASGETYLIDKPREPKPRSGSAAWREWDEL